MKWFKRRASCSHKRSAWGICKLLFIAFGLLTTSPLLAEENVTGDINFNSDWKFYYGSVTDGQAVDYDDSNWRTLNLPHDWAIEGPFDSKHNARTGGLPVHGTGWYRKSFVVPSEWDGKRIAVSFDGAMSNAHVWINGRFVGNRPYGYSGFEFDITDKITVGKSNIIAVRLTPEDLASRWYPGAGIYRQVRLKVNDPLHIPQWGTFVTTPLATKTEAVVNVSTTIRNDANVSKQAQLVTTIIDDQDHTISKELLEFTAEGKSSISLEQNVRLRNPSLWNIGHPNLYKAISQIVVDDKVIDVYETEFGIRTIRIDAQKGVHVNGNPIRLNGVCMHHDLGPLGAAVNYRATERQMEIMQSMGVNSLRTSHNPPSPEMLQVCDRLGILVIVEAFDEWRLGKIPNGYHKVFDQWHERDLRDMIRRDRNHPSVFMWSIGNEILEQNQKDGWKLTKHLTEICHEEDSTRPSTVGFNYYPAPFENKLAYYVDVVGMNYWPLEYADIKARHPDMIVYGSETASQTSSRGIYHLPWSPDEQRNPNQISSYDVIVGPPWAYAPDAEFDVQEANPFVLGEYIWTGFDYLGEPTPYSGRDNSTHGYWNDDWPSRSSYFAPVDLCGFPKDRYYLYQSQWTEAPMVHVLPHWNWEDHEEDMIPVVSYTNCDEVELFVNGKSYGKKVKGIDTTTFIAEYHSFPKGPFESKYRLSWNVPFASGSLRVVGYRGGHQVASKTVMTASAPAKIQLTADRSPITADGKDLSFITVRILDIDGNICPKADNLVEFSIKGCGDLITVGNGDATALTSYQARERVAFNGMCLGIVRSQKKKGPITVTATSEGLTAGSITVVAQ
ncbi:beta-galactosidase GalB [Planctomycetota bacterium]